MNFEIAPKSTEIQSTWDEARMYCFSLGEGWRLPTTRELQLVVDSEHDLEQESTDTDWYWTSDHYMDRAAVVFGGNGATTTESKTHTNFVRLVRNAV